MQWLHTNVRFLSIGIYRLNNVLWYRAETLSLYPTAILRAENTAEKTAAPSENGVCNPPSCGQCAAAVATLIPKPSSPAMLIPMMPPSGHGAITGLYSMSRGVGVVLGPVLGGLVIDALKGPLSSTQGYSAMWLVCSAAVALSIPLLALTKGGEDERRLGAPRAPEDVRDGRHGRARAEADAPALLDLEAGGLDRLAGVARGMAAARAARKAVCSAAMGSVRDSSSPARRARRPESTTA